MAVIDLSEAEILKRAKSIPLAWALDGSINEPIFDYDEDGEPKDFGIDDEPPDPTLQDLLGVDTENLIYSVSPSQFAETAIRVPEAGRVSDFSFEGREYLRKIYDSASDKVLLKCGRQVEKCSSKEVSKVLLHTGEMVSPKDVKPGDKIKLLF